MREMSESSKPLTRCLVCRYDLRGLPAGQCCPECGLGADDSIMTWRIKGRASKVWIFSIICSVLVSLASTTRHIRDINMVAVFGMMLVAVGIFWIRRRPRALLSQSSIAIRGRWSWRYEVLHFADLHVVQWVDLDIVNMEPLPVKSRVEERTDSGRRTVLLVPLWMTQRQATGFREELFKRWIQWHEKVDNPTAFASASDPP